MAGGNTWRCRYREEVGRNDRGSFMGQCHLVCSRRLACLWRQRSTIQRRLFHERALIPTSHFRNLLIPGSAHLVTSAIFLLSVVCLPRTCALSSCFSCKPPDASQGIPCDVREMEHFKGKHCTPNQRFLQCHVRSTHRASSSTSSTVCPMQAAQCSGQPMGAHHRECCCLSG